MKTKAIITEANVHDAVGILELQKLAYQSEATLYSDWNLPPLTQTLEEIRVELKNKVFLTAHYGGLLVGSVRAKTSEDDGCSIRRLIVHPKHQGQSIGTQLMHAIEARFPSATRFVLFTGERSEGNIRLYRRLGY